MLWANEATTEQLYPWAFKIQQRDEDNFVSDVISQSSFSLQMSHCLSWDGAIFIAKERHYIHRGFYSRHITLASQSLHE
jgi:hypothetical protein